MKKFIIVCTLMFSAVFGYSQQVPEKSNAIVITLPDSNGINDKIVKVFTKRDYTIAPATKTSIGISTTATTLKNGTRVSYNAQPNGTDIILTGKVMIAGQSNMVISYQGKKGTPFMNGWEEMEKIAAGLGGKIRYEKR